jgi:hypothetical protein
MPRKKTKHLYFTQETEDAIVLYNKTEDPVLRSKIYKDHIKYPFEKLVENIIHTFKFYYFDVPSEDVQNEVIAFLNEKIHKFKAGKGKAFSYFSIIAKNYLIIQNNTNYKRLKRQGDLLEVDEERNLSAEASYSDYQEQLSDFVDLYINWYDANMNTIFVTRKDIAVADSVLELFRIRENIDNFNKKALYILIRERTGFKTQNITRVINVMKSDFKRMFINYQETGYIHQNLV